MEVRNANHLPQRQIKPHSEREYHTRPPGHTHTHTHSPQSCPQTGRLLCVEHSFLLEALSLKEVLDSCFKRGTSRAI